jgi:hypothetical protein
VRLVARTVRASNRVLKPHQISAKIPIVMSVHIVLADEDRTLCELSASLLPAGDILAHITRGEYIDSHQTKPARQPIISDQTRVRLST